MTIFMTLFFGTVTIILWVVFGYLFCHGHVIWACLVLLVNTIFMRGLGTIISNAGQNP